MIDELLSNRLLPCSVNKLVTTDAGSSQLPLSNCGGIVFELLVWMGLYTREIFFLFSFNYTNIEETCLIFCSWYHRIFCNQYYHPNLTTILNSAIFIPYWSTTGSWSTTGRFTLLGKVEKNLYTSGWPIFKIEKPMIHESSSRRCSAVGQPKCGSKPFSVK